MNRHRRPGSFPEIAAECYKKEIHRPWSDRPQSSSVWRMDVRERLAAKMKRLRKERGWSQEALADEAGLDRTYISGIERRVKNPTITVVERIASALKCRMGDLLD